jgi:hypothetical protein
MHRSWKVAVITAAVGALSVSSLTTAASAAETTKFTVHATTAQSVDLDVDGDGTYSQGDQSVFSDDLTQDGKPVGTSEGVCTATRVVSKKDFTVECVVTFDLPDGQITAQAAVDAADYKKGKFTQAITGGTGAYKNAGGEMLVELVEGGSEVTFFVNDLG